MVLTPRRLSADERRRLDDLWERRWPGSRPVADELRDTARASWVRFHSLPGSKRYPDDETEYGELLSRHHTVLAELADTVDAPRSDDVLLVTVSWSITPRPRHRARALRRVDPQGRLWRSLLEDPDPGHRCWWHVFVSRQPRTASALDGLLRIVAHDETAGVIVADPDLRWLYHPYDGGADVIAPTPAARDALRAAHNGWLSADPSGL